MQVSIRQACASFSFLPPSSSSSSFNCLFWIVLIQLIVCSVALQANQIYSVRQTPNEHDSRELVADRLIELMDAPPIDLKLSNRMNSLWSAASSFWNQSVAFFDQKSAQLDLKSNLNDEQARAQSDQAAYEHVFGQWKAFGLTMQAMSDSFIQQLFRSLFQNQHIDFDSIQPQCTLALLQSMKALKTDQLWATQMLDASSKLNVHSLLDGTIIDLGAYDQCLAIEHLVQFNQSKTDQLRISGQYCLLKLSLPLPPKPTNLTIRTRLFDFGNSSLESTAIQRIADFAHAMYEHKIRFALCLPDTCSMKDIQTLFDQTMPSPSLSVNVVSCQTKQQTFNGSNYLTQLIELPANNCQVSFLIMYACLVLLVVVGSWIDLIVERQKQSTQLARAQLQQQFSLNCYHPTALWRPVVHKSLDETSNPKSSNVLNSKSTFTRQTASAANLDVSVGAGFRYLNTNLLATNNDVSTASASSSDKSSNTSAFPFQWPLVPETLSINAPTANRLPSRRSLDASVRRRQFQFAQKHRSLDVQPSNQLPIDTPLSIRLFGCIRLSVDSKLIQTLLAFSFQSNLKSLLRVSSKSETTSASNDPNAKMKSTSDSDQITCLNGFRVISMTWIILTHTYLLPIKSALSSSLTFMYVSESAWFQVIINGWVLVDSFFFISALLLTTNQMRLMFRTNGKINLIRLLIGRLLRIAPVAWFLLSAFYLLPVWAARGPLWEEYIGKQLHYCESSWWANLAFVNNWLPYERICMLHTWYLSAELQLFIISLLFLIPAYTRPVFGSLLLCFATLASCVFTFVYTYRNQLPPTVVYNTPNEMDVLRHTHHVYTITTAHIGPYCVGMLTGLAVHHWPKVRMSWFVQLLGTFLILSIALFILLFTQHWNMGGEWTPLSSAIYASTHRVGWSMCLAWIVYTCATGNNKLINSLLSCHLFEPLSKLSFCIYLVHFPLLWLRLSYTRVPLPFGHYTMFCEFVVNFWLSVTIAVLPYLLIEAPASKLYRIYFSKSFDFATITLKRKAKAIQRKTKMNSVQFSSIKDYN